MVVRIEGVLWCGCLVVATALICCSSPPRVKQTPTAKPLRREFHVVRACADNVRVGKPLGPDAIADARAISDSTFVALHQNGEIATSFDAGESWKVTLTGESGADWIEMDARGHAWAANIEEIWSSKDARTWTPTHAQPQIDKTGWLGLMVARGRVWTWSRDSTMTELAETTPPTAWKTFRTPDFMGDIAAVGNLFVGLPMGGKNISVDFDEHHATPTLRGQSAYSSVSCRGSACAIQQNLDLYFRDTPDQAWILLGDARELARWYVAHCNADKLGDVASIISGTSSFYQTGFVAFDGKNIAMALSFSRDNGTYYSASLILTQSGISVVPVGFFRVWVRAPGEFWFMSPNIHPVLIDK